MSEDLGFLKMMQSQVASHPKYHLAEAETSKMIFKLLILYFRFYVPSRSDQRPQQRF